jgi:hypothetical protein
MPYSIGSHGLTYLFKYDTVCTNVFVPSKENNLSATHINSLESYAKRLCCVREGFSRSHRFYVY